MGGLALLCNSVPNIHRPAINLASAPSVAVAATAGLATAGLRRCPSQRAMFAQTTIAAPVARLVCRARRPVVGGNWKTNPDSMSKLDSLISNIDACDTRKCDVYVCPSPLHTAYCVGKFSNDAKVTPQ